MTILQRRDEAHEHLTWLTAAIARALFVRNPHDRRLTLALERLAGCDFSMPQQPLAHAVVPACRWLPEALTAALHVAEEVAMALAAAHEHLAWRAVAGSAPADAAALAGIVGRDGALACPRASLQVLLTAPQARLPLPATACDNALLMPLSGEAAFRDDAGALRHVPAAEYAALPATTHVMSVSRTPLLAVLLRA